MRWMQIVELILQSGADPNVGHPTQGTPLLAAAAWGECDVVKLLLDHRSQINTVDSAGFTALHYACQGGHSSCVAALIDRGCDHSIANHDGHLAIQLTTREDIRKLFPAALQGRNGNGADVARQEHTSAGLELKQGHRSNKDTMRPRRRRGADSNQELGASMVDIVSALKHDEISSLRASANMLQGSHALQL